MPPYLQSAVAVDCEKTLCAVCVISLFMYECVYMYIRYTGVAEEMIHRGARRNVTARRSSEMSWHTYECVMQYINGLEHIHVFHPDVGTVIRMSLGTQMNVSLNVVQYINRSGHSYE